MVRTAILLVRDREAALAPAEEAVAAVRELLAQGRYAEVDFQTVPNEQARVRARLRLWADGDEVDLVLTIGGTGVAVRDRTPDATLEVVERQIDGLAERMRGAAAATDPRASLSRAVAGVRRHTLVVNLPAEAAWARAALASVQAVLPEAVAAVAAGAGSGAPAL